MEDNIECEFGYFREMLLLEKLQKMLSNSDANIEKIKI